MTTNFRNLLHHLLPHLYIVGTLLVLVVTADVSTTTADTLNQLSFLLPKEYSPKAVATALQLVVPAPGHLCLFVLSYCHSKG